MLCEYYHGYLFLLAPRELNDYWLTPRYYEQHTYIGKDELEAGIELRLRWDQNRKKCEATVIAVDSDYENISAVLDSHKQVGCQINNHLPNDFFHFASIS